MIYFYTLGLEQRNIELDNLLHLIQLLPFIIKYVVIFHVFSVHNFNKNNFFYNMF